MAEESLDDVFNDSETEEQVGQEQETEVAANEPEEEEEQGEPAAEESADEDAEPPAAEESPEDIGLKAALKSERTKRQAVEAELRQLREANPNTSDVDLSQFRRETSAMVMRSLKPDYDEKAVIFTELAKDNPRLAEECNASPNPALFAYEKAQEHLEIQDLKKLKDSDEYKQFLELKKKGELDPKAKRKNAALSVPSLNKAANTPPVADDEDDDLWKGAKF